MNHFRFGSILETASLGHDLEIRSELLHGFAWLLDTFVEPVTRNNGVALWFDVGFELGQVGVQSVDFGL